MSDIGSKAVPTNPRSLGFFTPILCLLFGLLVSLVVAANSWALTPRVPISKEDSAPKPGSNEKPASYIVVYRNKVSLAARLNSERSREIDVDRAYRHVFKGFSAELTEREFQRLKRDDAVLMIEPDRTFTTQQNGPQDRSPIESWGLDRIDQRQLPLTNRLATENNGFGVEAYIIDTGIRPDHNEFTGRVNPQGFSAVTDGKGWTDCDGHGTHVAGTVAGSTFGVAPKATLTSVRVLDCDGKGRLSDVVAGIDWMVGDHREGEAAVANMSLGGPRSDSTNLAVKRAVEDGISVVVAAGNDSEDACESSPASAPEALSIGATSVDDAIAQFSNIGPCVDLFAPGREIKSAGHESPGETRIASGTSMASPHVAGAAALLLSRSPDLSPEAIADRVISSSTPGTPGDERYNPGCLLKRVLYVGSESDQPIPPPPPPPANDDFDDAEVLSGSAIRTQSISPICASVEPAEPGHGSNPRSWRPSNSVWFRWTAPSSGTLVLEPSEESFIALLSAYIGKSVDQLTLVARNPWFGFWSLEEKIEIPVLAGETYSIAVDGYEGRSSSFRLTGTLEPQQPNIRYPAPANDNFSNATVLTSPTSPNSGPVSIDGATSQVGERYHHPTDDRPIRFTSVWFRWTAPGSGELTIDRLNGQGEGWRHLGAYQGSSLESLVDVATLRENAIGATNLKVREGESYVFAIGTGWVSPVYEEDFAGTVQFAGEFKEAPVNDDFLDAEEIKLTTNGRFIEGDLRRATTEIGEPRHNSQPSSSDPGNPILYGPYSSVWYKWRAPTRGVAKLRDRTYEYYPKLAVYEGSSVDTLRSITAGEEEVSFRTQPGETYHIAVDAEQYGEESQFFLGLDIALFPPKIVSKPRSNTRSKTATFRFSGDPNTKFLCRLGSQLFFRDCRAKTIIRGLKPGNHSLWVRQTYGSIVSPSVAHFWWTR